MAVNEVKQIPNNVYNINQYHKALKRRHICLTHTNCGVICDEIKRRYTIEYERDVSVDDK